MSLSHSHDESLHAHDGDAHDHHFAPSATTMRALASALALTGGYAIVEAVGGWLAGSLALVGIFPFAGFFGLVGFGMTRAGFGFARF